MLGRKDSKKSERIGISDKGVKNIKRILKSGNLGKERLQNAWKGGRLDIIL